MKEKIKMWIFTKCLQIAAKIEPYKFQQCSIGLKCEANMMAIVPPDGKFHSYAFTFSANVMKEAPDAVETNTDIHVYLDGVELKEGVESISNIGD